MKCVRCGKRIPKGRLKAIPETELCVKCSEEVGGDYEVTVIEENLGSSIISKPFIQKEKRVIERIATRRKKS